jgi:acyl-CoA synthetase (AMP-forming)/AMP-acid ligase II
MRDETIVDVLRLWAVMHPERVALTFLEDGERPTGSLTYAALDRRCREIASAISPLAVGDRALVLLSPGLEFVTAFLGCLYAGVVPVPAYPPRNARHLPRIDAILHDADAHCVLTETDFEGRLKAWLAERRGALPIICIDRVPGESAAEWTPQPSAADSWRSCSIRIDRRPQGRDGDTPT